MKRKYSPNVNYYSDALNESKLMKNNNSVQNLVSYASYKDVFGHIETLDTLYHEEIMESDTLAAFEMLYSQFKLYSNHKKIDSSDLPPFPIIFRHQLYLTINDREEVDDEINRLCNIHILKKFVFKKENNSYLCVKNYDYLCYMKNIYNSLDKKYQPFFLTYLNTENKYTYFTKSKLCSDLDLSSEYQDEFFRLLTSYSCLSSYSTNKTIIYYNTIPCLTGFYIAIIEGRKAITHIIKSSKSVLTKDNLFTKKQKNLLYGVIYHYQDMLGLDKIELKKTPNGIEIIQLT